MLGFRDADTHEVTAWQERWLARLTAWFSSYGYDAPSTAARINALMDRRRKWADRARVLVLLEADRPVGTLALRPYRDGSLNGCLIDDVYIAPAERGRGLGKAAIAVAKHLAGDADRMEALVDPGDPRQVALASAGKRLAQTMIKPFAGGTAETPLPGGVHGRPMSEADFACWRSDSVREYAAEIAGSGALPPDEAAIRAAADFDALIPAGLDTPMHSFWLVEAAGERVGTIWLQHQHTGRVGWVYGVEVDPAHRGRGYGRATMIVGERACVAAGDTALALNVFGHNDVAIALYTGLGYRTVHQDVILDLPRG